MDSSKILIFGKSGQLAKSFYTLLPDAVFLGSNECDLRQKQSGQKAIFKHLPSAVINCSAYTAVDRAETEQDEAFALNEQAPHEMALACRELGIPFVHYSTDYVFDGKKSEGGYTEADITHPLNVYGASKLAGETAIQKVGGEFYIFRTSWVFSPFGQNFVKTMLRLGSERDQLSIVSDQVGAPTYAPHIAEQTVQILNLPTKKPGLYHLAATGYCSWYEFAKEIFALAVANDAQPPMRVQGVKPILASEYPVAAQRPQNSILDQTLLDQVFGIQMPTWQKGLEDFFKRVYGS